MERFLFMMVMGLLFSLCISAQDDVVIHETKVYKIVGGRQLKADVFHAADAKQGQLKPAIAFFHGGGWAFGSPSEFYGACERFARRGFITFSFQYRLSITEDSMVPHPDITLVECVKDARSAIRWVREHAAAFNLDPDKIVAGGQSAGGQLALSTAMFDNINEVTDNPDVSPVPNAILLYSSNVNTMEAWADMLMGDRREEIWSVSPYHNVRAGMPPAIAFHGTEDCMVPYWVVTNFRDKTISLGNHFELITLEGRQHYLGEGNEKYATYFDEEIMERTDVFLEQFGFISPTR